MSQKGSLKMGADKRANARKYGLAPMNYISAANLQVARS